MTLTPRALLKRKKDISHSGEFMVVNAVTVANAVLALDFMLLFLLPAAMTGDAIVRLQKGGVVWTRTGRYIDSAASVHWYLAGALAFGGVFYFSQTLLTGYLVEYLPLLPFVNIGAFWGFYYWFCWRNNYGIRKRWRWFAVTALVFLAFEPIAYLIGFGF
jgi:hypothetical protein